MTRQPQVICTSRGEQSTCDKNAPTNVVRRDRENTTILVTGLPITVESAAMDEYFQHVSRHVKLL